MLVGPSKASQLVFGPMPSSMSTGPIAAGRWYGRGNPWPALRLGHVPHLSCRGSVLVDQDRDPEDALVGDPE
jgi:hypothetical protein